MTDPLDQPEDDGMELALPFILCKSAGGPYDDDAFTAGYECGLIDKDLTVAAAIGQATLTRTVRTVSVPQLDLIAMHHSFTAEATADDEVPEWSRVTFTAVCNCGPE